VFFLGSLHLLGVVQPLSSVDKLKLSPPSSPYTQQRYVLLSLAVYEAPDRTISDPPCIPIYHSKESPFPKIEPSLKCLVVVHSPWLSDRFITTRNNVCSPKLLFDECNLSGYDLRVEDFMVKKFAFASILMHYVGDKFSKYYWWTSGVGWHGGEVSIGVIAYLLHQ